MSQPSHSHRTIDDLTTARQQQASDPHLNVFVSANAGSGKTHVLVQRVIRILLEGTAPGRILCLTYTKAAAANMAERVHATLAQWTLLDDGALADELSRMDVATTPQALLQARRLFARAIETPGGLKLQTIHAFCERILHLFPFESNTPAGFRVMEESDSALLLSAARSDLLTGLMQEDPRLRDAIGVLAAAGDGDTFDSWLKGAQKYRESIASSALDDPGASMRALLGSCADDTRDSLQKEILSGPLGPATWECLAGLLERGLKSDVEIAGSIRNGLRCLAEGRIERAISARLSVFFTEEGEGTPRTKLLTKKIAGENPQAALALQAESQRLEGLRERLRGVEHVRLGAALSVVAEALFARYEARKRAQGLLDFADLIGRVRALLQRADTAWVLYKLDAGIDHILIDEAQDTAPEQWEILRQLAEDLTVGASANTRTRSLFAVADPKQSIYSFQGADPARFSQMARYFAREFASSERSFVEIQLLLSMRSSGQVLQAVEAVFKRYPNGLASQDEPFPAHEAARRHLPGYVEITESFASLPGDAHEDWTLPEGRTGSAAPVEQLARHVASTIAGLLAPDAADEVHDSATGLPRKVRADDILVLVRSRNKVFTGIITALKEKGVPVAGADRLRLNNQIAVRDLMALGRVLLLRQDDLSLAAVMKSPLLGLDDTDLIALAPERDASLWEALEQSAAQAHRAAAAKLASWRTKALDLTPFGFYADVLMAGGARLAFNRRLGAESLDAIDEFMHLALEHEIREVPSLSRFLSQIEAAEIDIKRDMEASGGMVRVMTVHGAKGLEAKIVFLPDTCSNPRGGRSEALIDLAEGGDEAGDRAPPRAILAVNKGRKHGKLADAESRQVARAAQEHGRLLYVAMTRAEERLYISGHDPKGKRRPADCWYEMMVSALTGLAEGEMTAGPRKVWRLGYPLEATGKLQAPLPKTRRTEPSWLHQPAPKEAVPLPPISPSQAMAAADQTTEESAGPAPHSALALERGRALHLLLQHLPRVAPLQRAELAERLLASGLPAWQRAAWIAEASEVLELASMQALFSAEARVEVAIAGRLLDRHGRIRDIAGQIDLLAVTPDGVDIADYKTGRVPDSGRAPTAYVRQLALYRAVVASLYPGRPVRAHLIYTAGPLCIELPPHELDAALAEALD